MTFLSPIPALIAAAITGPVLLFLYFLKLRRRPIRVSSTLLWDQAIRDLQVNVPFRLIRPTWILFLQLLILTLFLFALARPAIDLPQGAPSRVVLLIDRSASMSATDGDTSSRSRFEVAKDRALASLQQLFRSAGTSFAVIGFGAEASVITSFTNDPGPAAAAIRAMTPTDQPGNLRAALQLAGGLFTGDADETKARQRGLAMLFSDGSFADADSLTLPGAEFRFQNVGPRKAANSEGVSTDSGHENVGIVALAARREWEDPTVIRLFARVQNASNHLATVPLTLTLDGKEAGSEVLQVPAAAPAAGGTALVPGQASATFKIDTREGGTATVRINRPDLLATDNQASVILAPASKPVIVLVTPDPSPATPDMSWLISQVIRELQLPMRTVSASVFNQEPAERRESLVIFDRVAPATTPRIPSLSFGAGLPGISAAPAARGTHFLSWRRAHPVLRNASPDGVYVAKPLLLSGITPDDELARGLDGALIASVPGTGPRRLIVAFELSQSTWPKQISFPIFLASAIEFLTMRAEDRAGSSFTTAEPASVEPIGSGPIAIDGPLQRTIRPQPGAAPGTPVSLGILELAGTYRVTEGTSPARNLAVNLFDETESAIGVGESLRVSGQVVPSGAGDNGPREVWPWFVLAALILLAIEWIVNAWLMRT